MNDQETAYRLCHQDFQGLSTAQAALYMDITPRRVQQLLAALEKKAPQLFPVLTKIQARDYHLYCIEGWTMTEIAENTDRTLATISDSIAAAIKAGMPKPTKSGGILRYTENMDGQIREVF